jgi:hypothetical protein
MNSNNARIIRVYQAILGATPERVFPLLCPVREYDWLPHWRCEMLYSESGFAELGCVFATDFHDAYGREIWVVSDYQPPVKIGFVRIGAKRTTRYGVMLSPINGDTEITWCQEITAVDTKGQALVAAYTEEHFLSLMKPLNQLLHQYLQSDKLLPSSRLTTKSGIGGANT